MAALRPSPVSLRPAAPFSVATVPVSSYLPRLSFTPRRLPSLRLASPFSPRPRRGATVMSAAASSYASALAEVAQSNGTLQATLTDIEKVEQVFTDPAVQSFFADPTVASERKVEVMKEIAASCELQPHTANFLNILLDMRRIGIFKEIVEQFEVSYNQMTNTEVAVVSSVVRLESQDLAQIAQVVQRLTGAKNVRIKTLLDPSLIAGFTIRYGQSGSKFIDLSVRKQLNEIASQLDFSSISLSPI